MKRFKIVPATTPNALFAFKLYQKKWYGWKFIAGAGSETIRLLKNHLLSPTKYYSSANSDETIVE